MNETIYISIPSVKDPCIYDTVFDAINNAKFPENIHIGICHSIPFNNKKIINEIEEKIIKNKNISNKFINFYRNIGVGYGRVNAYSMYNNEDYFLQIDSHTMFLKNWDEILIKSYKESKKILELNKLILTAYLAPFYYKNKNEKDFVGIRTPSYPCFVSGGQEKEYIDLERINYWKNNYEKIPMWITPIDENFYDFLTNKYEFSRKINANFIFSDRNFAKDYLKLFPYNYLFYEEEFLMSVEAYSLGYKFVFPNFEIPLGHLYAQDMNEFSGYRKYLNPDKNELNKNKLKIEKYFEENENKIKNFAEYSGLIYPDLSTISPKYIPIGK